MPMQQDIIIHSPEEWESRGRQKVDELFRTRGVGMVATRPGLYFIFDGETRDFGYEFPYPKRGLSAQFNNGEWRNDSKKLRVVGNVLLDQRDQPANTRQHLTLNLVDRTSDTLPQGFSVLLGHDALDRLEVVPLRSGELYRRKSHMHTAAAQLMGEVMLHLTKSH